jgi:hypothetical protein
MWTREDAGFEWRHYAPDLLIAGALLAVAFLVRRHGLPTDGLWLDDGVTGAGLDASSPSQLLTVGSDHPGFIAGLIGWRDIVGGGDAALAYPALIAGTFGPPLLYLGLRACGYERSVGALLGAALAAAGTAIVYSGRVKGYTIDLLVVLALALAIPFLVRTRWRWYMGLIWIAVTAIVAPLSGFALIAVAVAGAIVVLHPTSDLRVRVPAVGIQAAGCIALLVAEQRTYDGSALESQWRDTWDAFVPWDANPITLARGVLVHLRRIAEVFPGGPEWLTKIVVLVALAGLAVAAWRGRQAIRARYLLLVIVAALVASVAGKLPFGPTQTFRFSDGGRVSLWLVPVLAIGLAVVLHWLRRLVADRHALRIGFDAAVYLGAAALLVSALAADQLAYPFPGARSAAQFVDSHLGPRDAVLIGQRGPYTFAVESDLPSGVEATPQYSIGFVPEFPDPRVHLTGLTIDRRAVAADVKGAERVFVYNPEHAFSGEERRSRAALASTLAALDFKRERTARFQDAEVDVWRGQRILAKASPATAPTG